MNKDLIRAKCDRILIDKQPFFSKILNNRIQKVYQTHADTLGSQIDYDLLTKFTSELLTAYSGVISEIMVQVIQEVLSDDEPDDFEDID